MDTSDSHFITTRLELPSSRVNLFLDRTSTRFDSEQPVGPLDDRHDYQVVMSSAHPDQVLSGYNPDVALEYPITTGSDTILERDLKSVQVGDTLKESNFNGTLKDTLKHTLTGSCEDLVLVTKILFL